MNITTPEEYMLNLEWEEDDLEHAKLFLEEWDKKQDCFYKKYKKIHKDADITEREHYRNCVNFWEKKLNENKSS